MNFKELINSQQPVLVDFYADWCGPCKTLSPIIKNFSAETKGKLKVLKVDVDRNQKAAMKYNIRSIPTMILFQNGKVKWRHTGMTDIGSLRKSLSPFLS